MQDVLRFFLFFFPDDFSIRDDLSFNHKKPKKSEISELEESESLLQQLCEITSVIFPIWKKKFFSKNFKLRKLKEKEGEQPSFHESNSAHKSHLFLY